MTENEAFEHISNLAGDYKCFNERITHQESLILYNLIDEIQRYRAIGTIEEFKDLEEKSVAKKEIRAKAIDEFAEKLKAEVLEEINEVSETQKLYEVGSDMSIACSHIMGTLRDVYHRIVDKIAEQLKAGGIIG